MKRKTKQTLKTLALSVLGIGAIVGACAGINAIVEKQDEDLKVIYPVFEVGGLNETDGKYEKSDKTLYTKNAFECQGLEIKLAFDNYIDYQVFFYEDDGDFISCTEVFSDNQDLVVPFSATHARIELTPIWAEMGEDYDTKNEQIVKWYETAKYSSQLEVKVNKEQLDFDERGYSMKPINSVDCDDEKYQNQFKYIFYEEDMTWEDWVNSSYNIYNATLKNNGTFDYISLKICSGHNHCIVLDDSGMPSTNFDKTSLIKDSTEIHFIKG